MTAQLPSANDLGRLEPSRLILTDFLCLQVGFALAAAIYPILIFVWEGESTWLLVCKVVWAIACAVGFGATLSLWVRDLRYERAFGPGEWLVTVQGALLLHLALLWCVPPGWFVPERGALVAWHEWLQTSLRGRAVGQVVVPAILWSFALVAAPLVGPVWRRRLRVPFWLASATLLWSVIGVATIVPSDLWGETFYYSISPAWDEIPEVFHHKLVATPSWLGPGLLLGIPIATLWYDWNRNRRKLRRAAWAGLAVSAVDLAGAPVETIVRVMYYEHIWWTELIWQLPTALLVLVGSGLGAHIWRRYRPPQSTF